MSFSWADPHFSTLFALREEERLAARLAALLRERAPEGELADVVWGRAAWSSVFEGEALVERLDHRRQL